MAQTFNNYDQALDFLFRQLPMYQRKGQKAYKPGLGNIKALLAEMGNPETSFPSIHIAGTNGKGSTSHMIAAILQASGLKVGLYTSPHYADFRERIKVNGQLMSKEALLGFLNNHYSSIEKVQPSYFELTVAMAFDYFSQEEVDVTVIETGLGGLLDSTNVIRPLLSIITNIGYDHQNILGHTLELIAFQKAGIIKPDTPVVIGELHPETKGVFLKVANEKNAPIQFADQLLKVRPLQAMQGQLFLQVRKHNELWFRKLILDTSGSFQLKNVCTALAAALALKTHFNISEPSILNGLSQLKQLTSFIGRWQILAESPLTITDAGHNEEGLRETMTQLATYSFKRLHMVIGFAKDKDHAKMLNLFPEKASYYYAKPNVPRGLDAQELLNLATEHQRPGKAYESVGAAIKAAQAGAGPDDFIFIGGSSFVVADALIMLNTKNKIR